MGGRGDRIFCVSAMVLLFYRGLDKKKVKADVKANAKKWKKDNGRSKVRTVELPWYAFDKHTQAGQIALGIFMKHSAEKYNISRDDFWNLWFYMESAKTPKHLLRLPTDTSNLTAFDSAWWLPYVASKLPYKGYTAKGAAYLWKTKIRDDIKGAVHWILRKRENG